MPDEDPWRDIARPPASGQFNARRVSAECPWPLYWAVDASGGLLLLLRHGTVRRGQARRLPRFRGGRM